VADIHAVMATGSVPSVTHDAVGPILLFFSSPALREERAHEVLKVKVETKIE
jgi:hypothetical protein